MKKHQMGARASEEGPSTPAPPHPLEVGDDSLAILQASSAVLKVSALLLEELANKPPDPSIPPVDQKLGLRGV